MLSTTVNDPAFFREIIRNFKKSTPGQTTSSLAKEINISQSSLCKIENLQKMPSIEEQIKIIIGTGNANRIVDVLSNISKEAQDALKEVLIEQDLNKKYASTDESKYFKDPNYYFIMLMAYSPNGTTTDEIKEHLGNFGLRNTDLLIKEGILSKEGNNIFASNGIQVTSSQETLKSLLLNCIQDCYKPEKFGSKENTLRFQKFTCDKKKSEPIIYKYLKECFENIMKELSDPAYKGNDKMFIGCAFDTLSISSNHSTKGAK